MFSDGNIYTHNTFRKNGAGVAVMYTRNIVMEHNTFENVLVFRGLPFAELIAAYEHNFETLWTTRRDDGVDRLPEKGPVIDDVD